MSKLAERIKSGRQARTVTVPEWGEPGKPEVLHFHAPNLNNVSEAIAAGLRDPVAQNVDVLVQIARKADGKPYFADLVEDGQPWRIEARRFLMTEADATVVGRLIREMGIVAVDEAETEKN